MLQLIVPDSLDFTRRDRSHVIGALRIQTVRTLSALDYIFIGVKVLDDEAAQTFVRPVVLDHPVELRPHVVLILLGRA